MTDQSGFNSFPHFFLTIHHLALILTGLFTMLVKGESVDIFDKKQRVIIIAIFAMK